MQAIVTKYYGATNFKPSKIVAKSASGLKVSVSYEHEYTADENHRRAAQKLCDKYGWTNELLGGGLSNSEEVWVMIPRHMQLVPKVSGAQDPQAVIEEREARGGSVHDNYDFNKGR